MVKSTVMLKLVIGLFLQSVFMICNAQQTRMDINDAILSALKNNTTVRIANMDVVKAEAAVKEAYGYAYPTIDFSTDFSHFLTKPLTAFPDFEALLNNLTYKVLFDEGVLPQDDNKYLPMSTKLQSFAQTNSFESKFTITQTLFSSTVFRGIGASQIYLDLSKEKLKSVVAKTISDVKKSFYGVLLSTELLKIVESSLKNAEENFADLESHYEQGLVSDFDRLQVEVQVENIKPKVLELKKVLHDSQNGLKILLGLPQSADIVLAGSLNYSDEIIISEDDAIAFASENNYDLRTLLNKRKVDEAFIALETSNYWPMLTAFGNYSYAGSSDDLKFSTYNYILVGLNLRINLFNGLRTARRVEQAEIGVRQSGEQIILTKEFLIQQIKSKLYELNRVRSEINALERTINLASKAYDISRARFNSGEGTQLEIKNADLELNTAKTNRLQSVYSYLTAKSDLDLLLGRIDEEYFKFMNDQLEK
ncbi:MAG: hypothetical protein COW85_10200 [Ignavibacteria bacterium CG22_combo_CG10-13_8_21_14_all_37_15]|nr:MAG: hypothetical protein COW85_10200 [Ignavibacteria bacterium CG22_combo_CG10-13_8_21_14_all_37_15]